MTWNPAIEDDPWAIARDASLSPEARLRRLRWLEYDVRQALVASEEGMGGPSALPSLTEVLAALAHVRPNTRAETTQTKM